MKAIKIVFVCLLLGSFSYAQSNKEEVDLIQAMFGKQKKEIIQAYMMVSDTQKNAFWSTYDAYEAERKAIGKEKIALIDDYANSYTGLTDEKATELIKRKWKLYESYGKLQKKYFDKFNKVIGGKETAKFFQLEDYIENVVRLTVQDEIPFIGELDHSKTK